MFFWGNHYFLISSNIILKVTFAINLMFFTTAVSVSIEVHIFSFRVNFAWF